MPKHSKSKKGTVEVGASGAAPARKSVQEGDLVRAQAQAVAVAVALTRARTLALAEVQVQTRAKNGGAKAPAELRAKLEAIAQAQLAKLAKWGRPFTPSEAERWDEAKRQVRVKARWKRRRKARASAWALELAEAHKALRTWMQALGQAQVQTWLSVGAPKAREVEVKRNPWPRDREDYWWLIQIITPIARLPPELLHQILLIVIDNDNDSPLVLMRVSKYWYNVVTGIWASLKLGTTTSQYAITNKLERGQWLLDVVVDTKMDRRRFTSSNYEAIFAAMQATDRWRTLIVESFPTQADLPEYVVDRGLQHCSDPVLSRLRTLIIKCPCEMSALLDRLLRILGNTASRELTTVTINSQTVISFLVPTYSSIFHSVTVLSLDAPGLHNPVDLLPHLPRLETLTASHLLLPIYHDEADLPLVHTLRRLTLRSVSIQWMSGRTFHVLESCSITFPRHSHVLHTFRTTLSSCNDLSFEGYPLQILSGVSTRKLTHLSVKCSSSYKPRGDRELALFSSQALQEGRLGPRILHITIEATNSAWTKALASMSNLEELVITNAQPSSLGVEALQSLVVLPGTTSTTGEWNTPLCPSLKRFGLRYRRWLRSSEQFDLIPVFMSIIRSRQRPRFSMQSFRIWTRSDEDDPLELIEGSSASSEGFERLKKYAAITGRNV